MTTRLKREPQTNTIQPNLWWEHNVRGSKTKKADKFIKHPVCQDSERYFLLYIMQLHALYKANIPVNLLTNLTVYPYMEKDESLQDTQSRAGIGPINVLALRKKNIGYKDGKGYYFGGNTFLVINTEIAGTLCGKPRASQKPIDKAVYSAQAKRPLTFNPHWLNELFNDATDPTFAEYDDLNQLELNLHYQAQDKLLKENYTRILLNLLLKMGIPVDVKAFISNSKALDVSSYEYA